MTNICTIGFSKKPLRKFVELLQKGKVTKLIDTRLNNTSQLSGFAKRDDLNFIMEMIGVEYVHDLSLSPTIDILNAYKKKNISWEDYEKLYLGLLEDRNIKDKVNELTGDGVPCFLCSEDKPHHCHRRILAEYLQNFGANIKIHHL
jgi:uncharacterized protein (DUF488 family)